MVPEAIWVVTIAAFCIDLVCYEGNQGSARGNFSVSTVPNVTTAVRPSAFGKMVRQHEVKPQKSHKGQCGLRAKTPRADACFLITRILDTTSLLCVVS